MKELSGLCCWVHVGLKTVDKTDCLLAEFYIGGAGGLAQCLRVLSAFAVYTTAEDCRYFWLTGKGGARNVN